MLRRLRNAALLVVLTLLLLELVLQVGALVVAWTHDGTPAGSADDGVQVVLCVGDSFTYGLGASDPQRTSYPAQLQARLDDLEPDRWRVVNAGHPGRNSRGVLERIDAQLREHDPDHVVVLVGLNDRWSQPSLLDLSATPAAARAAQDGFRLEWRTRRLWLWLRGRLRGDDLEQPPPELLGVEPFAPLLAEDDPRRRADANAPHPPDVDDAAAAGLAAEIRALPDTPDPGTLPRLRAAAWALVPGDPKAALDAAVRAFLLTGDGERFGAELAHGGDLFRPAALHTILDRLDPPRGAHERICREFAAALGWRQGDGIWTHPATGRHAQFVTPRWLEFGPELLRVFEVHRAHVEQVIARCRAHGAEPMLLGYPNRISVPDVVFAPIAAATDTRFVSTVGPIEAAAAAGADLFVADGHCNDAGYGVIAETVARALTGR